MHHEHFPFGVSPSEIESRGEEKKQSTRILEAPVVKGLHFQNILPLPRISC
jgi:hypothetical protein